MQQLPTLNANSVTTTDNSVSTTLKRDNFYKQQLVEAGLSLRYLLLHQLPDQSITRELFKKEKEHTYLFAYCFNKQTAEQFAFHYSVSVENYSSTTRFLYNPISKEGDKTHQLLVFAIEKDWIENNFSTLAPFFSEYIQQLPLLFNISENSILMNIDALQYLKRITLALNSNKTKSLFLRVNVLGLIEQFLSNADQNGELASDIKKSSYSDEMKDLAVRISFFLKTSLPDLSVFAKEYNMSLSSLKRHFKHVHGKPIYEYYLEQKMTLAKAILTKSNRTVTEVAYELGYEDPNGLIKSFKKVYGVPPGKLCA